MNTNIDTEIKSVRKALPKIKTLKNSQQFKSVGGQLPVINTVIQPNNIGLSTPAHSAVV